MIAVKPNAAIVVTVVIVLVVTVEIIAFPFLFHLTSRCYLSILYNIIGLLSISFGLFIQKFYPKGKKVALDASIWSYRGYRWYLCSQALDLPSDQGAFIDCLHDDPGSVTVTHGI